MEKVFLMKWLSNTCRLIMLLLITYITILKFLKEKYQFVDEDGDSIIVMGGSWGGNLASYMRMKFPHIIKGAFASSSVNLGYEGIVDPTLFGQIVTNSFRKSHLGCDEFIRSGFVYMNEKVKEKDFDELNKHFKICSGRIETFEEAKHLLELIEGDLEMLACINYPGESKNSQNLPEYPVKVTCERIMEYENIVEGMSQVMQVYYNYTGNNDCFDLKWEKPILENRFWRFQRCAEVVLPVEYNGKSDFFLPKLWNLGEFEKLCSKEFTNICPNPFWDTTTFNGKKFMVETNILFSNGLDDPWSYGGVYEEDIESSSVFSLSIENSAHHLDLRFPVKNDPESVISARKREKEIIESWIRQQS